jgi:predicted Zn-dependent protease
MTRYTIHATGQPGAKGRIRTALKLMGFDGVRIEEAVVNDSLTTEKPKPDNLPTSPLAKAVAKLFHRDETKPWTDEEIAAFRKASKVGMDAAAFAEVEKFYREQHKLEKHYCRTSILTFLRHFTEELDKARARADKPKAGKALEWSQPKNVVPMTDPAEAERIAAAAREAAKQFRESHGRQRFPKIPLA